MDFLNNSASLSFSKRTMFLGVTVFSDSTVVFLFIRTRFKQFNFLWFPVLFQAYRRVGHDMYLLSADFHIPSSLYISVYIVSFVF